MLARPRSGYGGEGRVGVLVARTAAVLQLGNGVIDTRGIDFLVLIWREFAGVAACAVWFVRSSWPRDDLII